MPTTPVGAIVTLYDSEGNAVYPVTSSESIYMPDGTKLGFTKLRTDMDDLQTEMTTVKTSVSEGKALVAAAVTDKGVPTAATDTYTQIAGKIRDLTTVNSNTSADIKVLTHAEELTAGQFVSIGIENAVFDTIHGITNATASYTDISLYSGIHFSTMADNAFPMVYVRPNSTSGGYFEMYATTFKENIQNADYIKYISQLSRYSAVDTYIYGVSYYNGEVYAQEIEKKTRTDDYGRYRIFKIGYDGSNTEIVNGYWPSGVTTVSHQSYNTHIPRFTASGSVTEAVSLFADNSTTAVAYTISAPKTYTTLTCTTPFSDEGYRFKSCIYLCGGEVVFNHNLDAYITGLNSNTIAINKMTYTNMTSANTILGYDVLVDEPTYAKMRIVCKGTSSDASNGMQVVDVEFTYTNGAVTHTDTVIGTIIMSPTGYCGHANSTSNGAIPTMAAIPFGDKVLFFVDTSTTTRTLYLYSAEGRFLSRRSHTVSLYNSNSYGISRVASNMFVSRWVSGSSITDSCFIHIQNDQILIGSAAKAIAYEPMSNAINGIGIQTSVSDIVSVPKA